MAGPTSIFLRPIRRAPGAEISEQHMTPFRPTPTAARSLRHSPRHSLRRALPALALPAALLLGACSRNGEAREDSAAAGATPSTGTTGTLVLGAQDVATAREGDVGDALTVSGPLEPKERVTIRAQVKGTVRELRVDRGSPVTRGQRLARIQAVGVQSQAAGARAQVASAQANLALAEQRLAAARRLITAGAISDDDLRSAVAQQEAAQAQLAAARAQAATSGEAAGYTIITAPISGVVSDRRVEEGEAVDPGDELLSVVNSRTLELAGQVGVADAGRVRVGQAVTFTLDAFPNREFRGRVARVDPVADPGTRQVGVYVELPNEGGRIVGGQFARGRIATGAGQAVRGVLIPATAVQGAGAGATQGSVLVVEGGRLARRAVTLGERDQSTGLVVVQSGVRAGEQVVVVPSEVKEGTPVTLAADIGASVPAADSAASAAATSGAKE